MSSIFKFKQFAVDQTGCAMKINTDGVLLGALADGSEASNVLDIGTGTGVIALMLAQRLPQVHIDAVELDEAAAQTASSNFVTSPFADRLKLYPQSFQVFFENNLDRKYDLIVSNPPFYIQSLPSPGIEKARAKHAADDFFRELIAGCAQHLTEKGSLWLILPLNTATLVKGLLPTFQLCVQQTISIRSYPDSEPHRQVLVIGFGTAQKPDQELHIYAEPKIYGGEYRELLKDFLTIF